MTWRDMLAGAAGLERRSGLVSIADPALAAYLGLNVETDAGESVTADRALGLTAVFRSVSLIAGTIAALPLKTYRRMGDDSRERVPSFLDDPGGPGGPTPFEWIESLVVELLLNGNAYGLPLENGAGTTGAVQLLPASAIVVEWHPDQPGRRRYRVRPASGAERVLNDDQVLHVPALAGAGRLCGLSPIAAARAAVGTGLAADRAAARMFGNGMLIGGLVTSEDDMTEPEAAAVAESLRHKLAGAKRAGDIAVVNRRLKFEPWTMNATDAQFIESRAHQVAEVARIFGVPKVLLAEDGASTWGSGIAELIRGMARFTLTSWTGRVESRLSRLLPDGHYCEFDYAGLLAPTPAESVESMAREIEVGLLTIDEARAMQNRPALGDQPAGDDDDREV